jgi:periplasmic divalent cation tolerance protein
MTTADSEEDARKIARALVEKRLAGCVQIIGPIESVYWWKKKIETAEEWLCVIKAKSDDFEEIEKAIRRIHSYETPEILATSITLASQDYLNWLDSELKKE